MITQAKKQALSLGLILLGAGGLSMYFLGPIGFAGVIAGYCATTLFTK